jgi:competence protein ComFC
MILDLFFPNRCIECSRIIDADLLVCGLCFEKINFTHFYYFSEDIIKEKCRLFFPVENTYGLMN